MANLIVSRLSLSASVFAFAAAFSAPAFAQTQPTTPATPDKPSAPACAKSTGSPNDLCTSGEVETESGQPATANNPNAIVVTGSRIRRPNLTSPVPITSISSEELTAHGDVNVGDALNQLPSLRNTFGQANSTRFIGTAGINLLDLRGLGVSRTLVLVNGRRHITWTPGDYQVDVQTIPTDLIERVDIVTGGSSAVYGSDAVAGVVNFILKRNFDGLRIRAQSGISSRGDRGINFGSVTVGRNFLGGRGNVALNVEYDKVDALFNTDRPDQTGAFDGRCQFNLATTGAPGVPQELFFCGVHNATISNGGTVTAPISTSSCENPAIIGTPNAALCLNPGTPLGAARIIRFNPTGAACQDIPGLDFRPFGSGNELENANSTCAVGSTLRDTGQIAPGLKRYMGNLLAHIDVSDAFKPFVEAKFVRVDALQEGQPSFFQGSFPGFFGLGRGIRCDNPFLTAQDLTELQTIGRCTGGATSTETIPLSRFNVDFGGRRELVRRDTYRVVGGVQGDFNDGWNYELSVNYGHLYTRQTEEADLHIFDIGPNGDFLGEGPFLQAIDAVRDPTTGQIVCRSTLTSPGNGCVPINVFGEGQPSQAALNFVNTTSFVFSHASELDLLGYVNGDSSKAFSLPGGPVRFVLGAEHREERADQHADVVSANGGTFFNAFAPFNPPPLKVTEGFGEIELPLLRDLPAVQELTATGAARYSHYNTSAGNTFAWNANLVYAPFRDLRFRANYSKSVRVPTQSDLFSPASQNFGFVSDPCDVLFINRGSQFRAANCAALGIPAGFEDTEARTQTIGFLSGGNPNLKAETGKSLTVGGVFTPHWIPGFSLTVDYYRIRVENLISVLSAQQIIDACVDLPSINNQFCPSITRLPDFTFANPALLSAGINFAKQEADGIDFEAAYRHNFANGNRLDFHGIATYVIRRNNFIDPTNPQFADQQLLELGDPRWKASTNVTYGFGRIDLHYSMTYFSKMATGAIENIQSVQGRPPQNPDFTFPKFFPAAMYHNLRVDFSVPHNGKKDALDFYVGVDNIFDKLPPLGLLGNGGSAQNGIGIDPYDPIGRYMFGGVTVDF
jgi:outer membrane receptor protein involved in Fe transport